MTEKKDLRIVKTEANIKNSLINLLNEKNMTEITVTELAKKAQIQRKTFYLHYEAIEDVVFQIKKDFSLDLEEVMDDITELTAGNIVLGLNQTMFKNFDFYSSLFNYRRNSFLIDDFKRMLAITLRPLFLDKQKLSVFKVNIYADFIASGVVDVYGSWLINDKEVTLEELTEALDEVMSPFFNQHY